MNERAAGERAAIGLWVRSTVRREWKGLVALGVLAGVTAALAAAALAGARRTETALPRLRDATNAADAVVFASQVGVAHPDWSKLREKPEVADLAVWDLMFGREDGQPSLLFVSNDGAWGGRMSRPVVTEGRLWDPAAPDEVIVPPAAAAFAPVGSTFDFQPFGIDQQEGDTTPAGPVITFRVVGVGNTVNRFLFTDGILVGPGFVSAYGDKIQLYENAEVKLRNGPADMGALQAAVTETIAPGVPVLDLASTTRRVDTAIGMERVALTALAAIVAIAGGLLVVQALGRSGGRIGEDADALRAVGMTRTDMVGATAALHVLPALVAAIVGAGGAIAASRFFPVGMGRQIDPDVGTHVDLTVILPAAMTVTAFVLAGSAIAARRATGGQRSFGTQPSRLGVAVRSHVPVTIGIGAGMALQPGAGRSRVAVRPALFGAIVGVLGVVGALTIEHSVTDALAHPERAGVNWDATISPQATDYGPQGLAPDLLASITAAAPAGTGITEGARFALQVDGIGVPAVMTLPYGSGPAPELTIIEGRRPDRDNEAAIGPKTARDLGVGIGDAIAIGTERIPITIVGTALFPPDVHFEFDQGLWLTPSRFRAVVPAVGPDNLFEGPSRVAVLKFPGGTDVPAAITQVGQALGGTVDSVAPAELPVELTNLGNVRSLPWVLAAFLGILAVAAVSHVLISSSHRRAHDLVVMRALGLTRRSSRLTFNAQATVIAAVGLACGLPLGVVVGRFGWQLIAERVPLQDVGPVPVLALVLTVPVAALLLNLLALWPGRTVAQLAPAATLREE